MVRVLLVSILAATWGCTFQPASFSGTPDDDPGAGSDTGSAGDPGPDAGVGTASRPCAFPDPELRLCVEFDDRKFAPHVTDASQMRLDPTATSVREARHDTGYSAAMAASSRIDVAESTALDLQTALTIEMWIWPGWAQPANLLVNANQYQLQLAGDGRIGCVLPTAAQWSADERVALPLRWTHVACTVEAGKKLTVYVDGRESGSQDVSSSVLSAAGTTGTKIGGGYGGGLDDIRIYARELSASEVCAHTGKTDCSE